MILCDNCKGTGFVIEVMKDLQIGIAYKNKECLICAGRGVLHEVSCTDWTPLSLEEVEFLYVKPRRARDVQV